MVNGKCLAFGMDFICLKKPPKPKNSRFALEAFRQRAWVLKHVLNGQMSTQDNLRTQFLNLSILEVTNAKHHGGWGGDTWFSQLTTYLKVTVRTEYWNNYT